MDFQVNDQDLLMGVKMVSGKAHNQSSNQTYYATIVAMRLTGNSCQPFSKDYLSAFAVLDHLKPKQAHVSMRQPGSVWG
jgi:hypothetical protein